MRLLTHDEKGNLVPKSFDGLKLPPYAILSHTWLPDNSKEVGLQDLLAGRAKDKLGYNKIRLCEQRIVDDGLKYFWIDTCCVDQSSSAELTEAINSMFRWYQQSTKCYVYLTDVPDFTSNERILRSSRWFTRGWTLQELIAPKVVEFFTADGLRLGDRSSLETTISEVTGMTIGALHGYPLSDFSIDERFRWAANRQTKKPEDKAYSLLGIFDVSMPVIYGEGEEKAMRRLLEQIDQHNSLRPDFGATDSPTASRSSASTTAYTPTYYLPFSKNRRFVGRHDELQELRQKLLIDKECQKIAIVGMGGIGKTQIALEFAQSVKREKLDYLIFWVPAVSLESYEQACTKIARILQIPQAADKKQDVKELVKQHLSDQSAGKWLLIVDNADDIGVMFGVGSSSGVVDFLPENDDGLTVFTSRRTEVAESLVGSDVLEVGKMSEEEAIIFLTASLIPKNRTEEDSTKQLVADLDFLPLAIAQAAAYINTNKITVEKYLGLIRDTDADLTAVMSREFRDSTRYKQSGNAVATTWVVSFEQIVQDSTDAMQLLSFVSCIEWKSIPYSILPTVQPRSRMIDTIGIICSYGFMTRREYGDVYDMHRLVHLAISIWLDRNGRGAEAREATMRHLADIFPFEEYRNRQLWIQYLPHASRIVNACDNINIEAKAKLELKVSRCLYEDGRVSEAVKWLKRSYQWRERHLPGTDSNFIALQYLLASVYIPNGQIGEAIELLEHVTEVRATLPKDDPFRLSSQQALADAYRASGLTKESIELLELVNKVNEQLPEQHSHRLASQYSLAQTYLANGQIQEAIKLLEHVNKIREKLTEDYPDLLGIRLELAKAYSANGQFAEAIKTLEDVHDGYAKLAEHHPHRLASQRELGRAYLKNSQIEQAVTLLENVVAVQEKKFAEEHPNRLASQYELAEAYQETGQINEAVTLLEHVVKVREKLAEDHPSRLASQHSLALAYRANGQIKQAVMLLEHVVKVREKVVEDHPSRLASQYALALAYRENGQINEAVTLLEHVVKVREKLAEDHPSLLASQHSLARTYQANGQIKQAVTLLEHVVKVREKLAEDHPDRLVSQQVLATSYWELGRRVSAVHLMRHVVRIRRRVLDEHHPSRISSEQWLEHFEKESNINI